MNPLIKMRSAIFLSVRNKATRLPGKTFLHLIDKTVIEHLIERLKLAQKPDLLAVCTSTHPDDSILETVAQKSGIDCFRGSEDDKLDRYLQAAKKFNVEFMAIVDGDDPFCDPVYIDRILAKAEDGGDFITVKDLPLGVTAFGLRRSALEKVCSLKKETNTEVWGSYFTSGLFKAETIQAEEAHRMPKLRMTLDYPEDFQLFHQIFSRLYTPGKVISLDEIMNLVRMSPRLAEVNSGVQEKYEQNLAKISPKESLAQEARR